MGNVPQKVTLREKLAYGCGDFGNSVGLLFVSTYLMLFFTNILGISAYAAGLISAGVVVFDAINDPIIGWAIDRWSHKSDTYRKILGFVAIPYAAVVLLLFVNVPFSNAGKVAWVVVVYCLWSIFATTYNTAYGGLATVITEDSDDRKKLAAFRDWGTNFGGLIVNLAAVSLILYFGGGDMNQRGFFMTAAIAAGVMLLAILFTSFGTRTRVRIQKEKIDFAKSLGSIFKNKNAIALILIYCLANTFLCVKSAMGGYYAIVYLGNEMMLSVILVIMCIVPLVGIPFIPKLTNILGRKVMFMLGGIITAISGICTIFGGDNLVLIVISSLLSGLTMCFTTTVVWGAVPDVIDFGAYKFDIFVPGMLFATLTFFMKIAQAGSNYAIGVILDLAGYEGTLAVQTAECAHAIGLWYGMIPVILGVLLIAAAQLFTLSSDRIRQIQEELNARTNSMEELKNEQ